MMLLVYLLLFLQHDLRSLVKRYITHWPFWVDLLSLLPLDLLYVVPYLHFNALLRLPRLLRVIPTVSLALAVQTVFLI